MRNHENYLEVSILVRISSFSESRNRT